MLKKKIRLVFYLLFVFTAANAQNTPFYNEIQQFKKQDSAAFPPKHAIVFVGSSSFTNWKDVQSYFPKHVIINRGFGGSSLPDVIRYVPDIIFKYEPKQVVIYCGENDFTIAGGLKPDVVVGRVKELITLIRKGLPDATITFVSIKPSPSRIVLQSGIQAANKEIKRLMWKMKNVSYIDVYDAMLERDGTSIRQDIFLKDKLHMNEKGYDIWKQLIEPYLKD